MEQGVDQILHLIYLLINSFGFSARQDILISDLPAGEAAAERNEVHETHHMTGGLSSGHQSLDNEGWSQCLRIESHIFCQTKIWSSSVRGLQENSAS